MTDFATWGEAGAESSFSPLYFTSIRRYFASLGKARGPAVL